MDGSVCMTRLGMKVHPLSLPLPWLFLASNGKGIHSGSLCVVQFISSVAEGHDEQIQIPPPPPPPPPPLCMHFFIVSECSILSSSLPHHLHPLVKHLIKRGISTLTMMSACLFLLSFWLLTVKNKSNNILRGGEDRSASSSFTGSSDSIVLLRWWWFSWWALVFGWWDREVRWRIFLTVNRPFKKPDTESRGHHDHKEDEDYPDVCLRDKGSSHDGHNVMIRLFSLIIFVLMIILYYSLLFSVSPKQSA